jgi:dTDP-glucose 4,6-dehydratase
MYEKYPDYDFVVFDKLTYASGLRGYSTENIDDLIDGKRVRFIKGDILDKNALYDAMYLSHACVNFAAESHVGRAMVQGERHLMSNDLGAVNVGEVAMAYHMRMLHISTDEVYGDILDGSFGEQSQFNPRNKYAGSKAAAEMNLRPLVTPPHNLDLVITRSANNFGRYQSQEKFTHIIAESIAKHRPIPIHGEGKEKREWLYVLDNCAAIDLVLHKGKSGEAYNISSHQELTNLELAQLAIKNFGGDIQFVPNRPGNDRRYSIDTTKVESLGWQPIAVKDKFPEYMLNTIRWYIENYGLGQSR